MTNITSSSAQTITSLPGATLALAKKQNDISHVPSSLFGAIGDGVSHTLSSLGYATLSAAQTKYPLATSLSDEADWCGLQAAFNYAAKNKCRLIIGGGTYQINRGLQFGQPGDAYTANGTIIEGANGPSGDGYFPNGGSGINYQGTTPITAIINVCTESGHCLFKNLYLQSRTPAADYSKAQYCFLHSNIRHTQHTMEHIVTSGGGVASFGILNTGGSVLDPTTALTAVVTGGVITGVTVNSGGSNWLNAPLVGIQDSTGKAAILQTVLTAGVITSVVVVYGGYGYSSPALYVQNAGANGETPVYDRCTGVYTPTFFYMGPSTGQALGPVFYSCSGQPNAGGSFYTIGDGLGGHNLHVHNQQGTMANSDGLHGGTFFQNNGVSGTVSFKGGRLEHPITIIGGLAGAGSVTFEDIDFDGMWSSAAFPFFTGGTQSGTATVNFKNCRFGAGQANTILYFAKSYADLTSITFDSCIFYGWSGYSTQHAITGVRGIKFINCSRTEGDSMVNNTSRPWDINAGGISRGSTHGRRVWDTNADQQTGVPQNALIYSNLSDSYNATIPAPWVVSGAIQVVDWSSGSANYCNQDGASLQIPAGASFYQDLASVTLGSADTDILWQHEVGANANTTTLEYSISNSVSGQIYDKAIIINESSSQLTPHLISLSFVIPANAPAGSHPRIKVANTGTGLAYYELLWQYVAVNSFQSSYALSRAAAVATQSTRWGLSTGNGRFTNRLSVPSKPDTFGSKTLKVIPDLAAGEMYVSTDSKRLQYHDGVKWQYVTKPGIAVNGDVSLNVTPGVDAEIQYFNTPLTSNRLISVYEGNPVVALPGDKFRLVRGPNCTGAFALQWIQGNGNVVRTSLTAINTWVEYMWTGTAWVQVGSGTLL